MINKIKKLKFNILAKITIFSLLIFSLILSMGIFNISKIKIYAGEGDLQYAVAWEDTQATQFLGTENGMYRESTEGALGVFVVSEEWDDLYLQTTLTSGSADFISFQVWDSVNEEWVSIVGEDGAQTEPEEGTTKLSLSSDNIDFIIGYADDDDTCTFKALYSGVIDYEINTAPTIGKGSLYINDTLYGTEDTIDDVIHVTRNYDVVDPTDIEARPSAYSSFVKFIIESAQGAVVEEFTRDHDDVSIDEYGIASMTLELDKDIKIQAVFESFIYTVSVVSVNQDEVELSHSLDHQSNNSGLLQLSVGDMLGTFQAVADGGWRFLGWKYANGSDFFETAEIVNQFELTADIIDNHIIDGELKIYAVFEEQAELSISVQNDWGEVKVSYTQDGNEESYTVIKKNSLKVNVNIGTKIKLEIIAFDGYKVVPIHGISLDANGEFELTASATIMIDFEEIIFTLSYESRDSFGEVINGDTTGIDLSLTDINANTKEMDEAEIDTNLNIVLDGDIYDSIEGYRFDKFLIYNYLDEAYDEYVISYYLDIELAIDSEFFDKYVRDEKCLIIGVYINLYEINISIAKEQEDRGSLTVKINGVETTLLSDEPIIVEHGWEVEILASATKYCSFYSFTGVTGNEISNNEATLTATGHRNIIVNFEKQQFDLDIVLTGSYKGKLTQVTQTVELNEDIVLTFTPDSTYEILDWKVNGVKIKDLDNVTITGNTISIKATSSFLDILVPEDDKIILSSNIQTIMNTTIFYILIIGSVSLVVLVFAIVTMTINRKGSLKKQKEAEEALKKALLRFNVTSFISDLKK